MSSLTLIIPALNEGANLAETVQEIMPSVQKWFADYEILVFDDGSTDTTGAVADKLAQENSRIKVTHNPLPMGLGYNYKKGVKMAQKDFVLLAPGDNDILKESFEELFAKAGQADIVLCYTGNLHIRPAGRIILSRGFTHMMNLLFGLRMRYFNGIVLHRRELIQSIEIKTDSFAYQAEALIKLIKTGRSYLQVPQYIRERRYGRSKALYPKNVWRVIKAVAELWTEVHLKSPGRKS